VKIAESRRNPSFPHFGFVNKLLMMAQKWKVIHTGQFDKCADKRPKKTVFSVFFSFSYGNFRRDLVL